MLVVLSQFYLCMFMYMSTCSESLSAIPLDKNHTYRQQFIPSTLGRQDKEKKRQIFASIILLLYILLPVKNLSSGNYGL